jgi:hypothetical protein
MPKVIKPMTAWVIPQPEESPESDGFDLGS